MTAMGSCAVGQGSLTVRVESGVVAVLLDGCDISHDHRLAFAPGRGGEDAEIGIRRFERQLRWLAPARHTQLGFVALWYALCFPAVADALHHEQLVPEPVPLDVAPLLREQSWRAALEVAAGRQLHRHEVRKIAIFTLSMPAAARWLPLRLLPLTAVLGTEPDERVELLACALTDPDTWQQRRWQLADSQVLRSWLDLVDPERVPLFVSRLATAPDDARCFVDLLHELDGSGHARTAARAGELSRRGESFLDAPVTSWLRRHGGQPTPWSLRRLHGAGSETGWRLLAPADGWQVNRWGQQMCSCLGQRYAQRIVRGEVVVLGATDMPGQLHHDTVPKLVVELPADAARISALLGSDNRLPDAAATLAVWELLVTAGLLPTECRPYFPHQAILQLVLAILQERRRFRWEHHENEIAGTALWVAGYQDHTCPATDELLEQLSVTGPHVPPHRPATAVAVRQLRDERREQRHPSHALLSTASNILEGRNGLDRGKQLALTDVS